MAEQTDGVGLPALPAALPKRGVLLLRAYPIWTEQRWPDNPTYKPVVDFDANLKAAYEARAWALTPVSYDKPKEPFSGRAGQIRGIIDLARNQAVLVYLNILDPARWAEVERQLLDALGEERIAVSVLEAMTATEALVSWMGRNDLTPSTGTVTIDARKA